MSKLCIGLLLLVGVGCGTSQYAERLPAHPAAAMPLAPVGKPQQAPAMPPADAAPAAPIAPTAQPVTPPPAPASIANDDAATQAWLSQQIERHRYVPPPPPPPPVEIVERVVERPVYVNRGGYYHTYPNGYYDSYGYYDDRWAHRRSTFPVHTALGAGIGAVVGHQSGRRGRGAWIGGGLGLLFDLSSRW